MGLFGFGDKKKKAAKLFMDAFNMSTMLRFKMLNDRLIVVLDTIKLEKHQVYYLVDLLSKIKFKNDQ